MKTLEFDYKNVLGFVGENEILSMEAKANSARRELLEKTGVGNDFVDWVDWPIKITSDEVDRIKKCASRLRKNGKYLVVIGIGGSYLGAKAGLEMLDEYFVDSEFEVVFAGNSFSSTYSKQLLKFLADKDFSAVVISKSGTTTESAIAFRLIKELLLEKYADYSERIVAITTNHDSALHTMACKEGYEEFFIPDGIGGRYSVLTAVGLLPLAYKGYDIYEILKGSKDAYERFSKTPFLENEALLYASVRNALYNLGKETEILAFYEPKLRYIGEWWKQLYGESEGKDGKGLFPASVIYSTDLHSLGQYVQDGKRNLFETVVEIENPEEDLLIKSDDSNLDKLNYLAGKSLNYVNSQAMKGTIIAHVNGEVPNILIKVKEISCYTFGYMVYFFMFACGVSGYLLGVNPFNQKGVEAYKKKMFELLGKPKN